MRFLADENFPAASVRALRAEGHDVAAVGETQSGAEDSTVLQIAREQQRVLVTFDRDFGVLVFGDGNADVNLIGMFTVVDREKTRQRTLPRAAG